MKRNIIKIAALGVLTLGLAGCADDLNIHSIDPQSDPSYDATELLAKQYATLAVTGQAGPAGKGDISGDEGESGFYRTMFNLNELMADEAAWAWQNDYDMAAMLSFSWNSSTQRVYYAYMRLAYDITLYNSYLDDQADKADPQSLAEVRFLRALHYWYYLDLFHRAPFAEHYDGTLPVEKAGKDLYDWLDQELTAIEPDLAEIGSFNNSQNFGRADQGAAYALHARLALNSAVYTDGQVKDYQKAVDYCDKIINSGKYALATATKGGYSGYQQLFMGDNDTNPEAMKEIIFPIRQDGTSTESYAGSTFLVSSMHGAGMPDINTDNMWTCYFARKNMVEKFFPSDNMPRVKAEYNSDDAKAIEASVKTGTSYDAAKVAAYDEANGCSLDDVIKAAGDDRALLYAGIGGGVTKLNPGKNFADGFMSGAHFMKWTNLRTDGGAAHNRTFSDTDIPVFRLAEVYLTRAEAEWRLGNSAEALKSLNVVTVRARGAANAHTSVSAQVLIDEWAKEFYMEGRRRSDLVRFGLFTGSKYVWDWKGGIDGGSGVDSHYNVYPIPANDLAGNPNMNQNAGY